MKSISVAGRSVNKETGVVHGVPEKKVGPKSRDFRAIELAECRGQKERHCKIPSSSC